MSVDSFYAVVKWLKNPIYSLRDPAGDQIRRRKYWLLHFGRCSNAQNACLPAVTALATPLQWVCSPLSLPANRTRDCSGGPVVTAPLQNASFSQWQAKYSDEPRYSQCDVSVATDGRTLHRQQLDRYILTSADRTVTVINVLIYSFQSNHELRMI